MNVKNCKQCGRLFNYVSGIPICPICKKEAEDKFIQVKQYLQEHKNASIAAISEDNDVSIKQLHQWVLEERLILAKNPENEITCQRCGEIIETGKYCQKCKDEMASAFKMEFNIGKGQKDDKKADDKQGPRMRYL